MKSRHQSGPSGPAQTTSPSNAPDLPTALVRFEDFAPLLPIELTKEQAKKWSYTNKFPRSVRIISNKSVEAYPTQEIILWVRREFGDICPAHVARFEAQLQRLPKLRLNFCVGADSQVV